ncbi:YceD family protein [Actinomyces sp. B33]|uniref:YceD family protein n=1 Tax=Actinomyces sp. B33 TaxID=2942131 RepID=UPI0023410AD6|nr:YceD family protein [Actinomyces sp. B33]MDC4233114.1 YceD family protein [Actinomyces sp. B33]
MSDPRLLVSLAALPRALGSMRHEDIAWTAPDDLGTPAMAVPEGDAVDLSVDLTSVDDGVLVQIATSVDLVGECVRCLDEVRAHHDVSSAEVYVEPAAARAAAEDDGDDVFVIGARDTVDVETQVRDAIITLVDERPLCRPDCAGLCDVCGLKWEDLPDDHGHESIDPRLASLAALLPDAREQD